MAGRGRNKPGPKGLCAYLVEIQDCDGKATVPPEYSYLVRKCVEDKLFSANTDHVSINRSDNISSIDFNAVDWDVLRKAIDSFNLTRIEDSEGTIENPISGLSAIVKAINAQMKEDSYNERKILFFATLSSYILDEKELIILADKLVKSDVFLSIVVPNKEDRSELQQMNFKALHNLFSQEKYEDFGIVSSLRKAQLQIFNTLTKKLTRPNPWNVSFEITEKITIQVSGYVGTRKNKPKEMVKVFMKQAQQGLPVSSAAGSSNGNASTTQQDILNVASGVASMEVEVGKEVLQKESFYTEQDGERIAEEDLGKGFYYGDKLILQQQNQNQKEDVYKTGEKCMKLMAFCPKENISPFFFSGDGTTFFYPRKDNQQAEALFKALFDSLVTLDRIAIVRKVYRKDAKALMGALSPNVEKGCLIFNELCYGDDICIPDLPLLIKPEETEHDEVGDGAIGVLNEKEELIDDLIKAMTLNSFDPIMGPADPSVALLREQIAAKVLKGPNSNPESVDPVPDNIQLYFQNMILEENLVSKMKEVFPLTEVQIKDERLAGINVFKKRPLEEDNEPKMEEAEKKPKLDEENEKKTVQETQDIDFDELLGEL